MSTSPLSETHSVQAPVKAYQIVLLGPPGAGKGTQAKRLRVTLGLPHIASGDIFRAIRREDTPLAREVRAFMDRGEYVPDDLTIELVLKRLAQSDAQDGFLLDGFPRTCGQAQALEGALQERGRCVDRAIFITAPPDVLLKRLAGRIICPQCDAIYNLDTLPPRREMTCDACGHKLERRTDEAPDVVRVRLHTFIRQTEPIVDYYHSRGLLTQIDGTKSLSDVESDIQAAIRLECRR